MVLVVDSIVIQRYCAEEVAEKSRHFSGSFLFFLIVFWLLGLLAWEHVDWSFLV